MIGRRTYWPKAPIWLHKMVYGEVDQPDVVVSNVHEDVLWTVRWAEAERLAESAVPGPKEGLPNITVELWEVRYQLMGWRRPVERVYVVDATVWLPLGIATSTAFFQTMSFAGRATAESHYERLRTRVPGALR